MSQKSDDDLSSLEELVNDFDKDGPREVIQDIQAKLEENKYQYSLHVDLITQLKALDDIEALDKARKDMYELFPMNETLWSEWLADEIRLASTKEEKLNVLELFDKANEDYLMIGIWKMKLEYTINNFNKGDNMEEDNFNLSELRSVFDLALDKVGYHLAENDVILDLILSFEINLLEELKSQEQINHVKQLFIRALSMPHKKIEENYQRAYQFIKEYFSSNLEDSMAEISALKSKSYDILEEREIYENELINQSHALEAYNEYISFELKQLKNSKDKNYSLLKTIYERTITNHPLDINLWEVYLNSVVLEMKDETHLISTAFRSVRNCNWSGSLWAYYLNSIENTFSLEDIDAYFNHALAIGLIQTNPEELLKLLLERCAIYRRKLLMDTETNYDEQMHDKINNLFKDTLETLNNLFPEADPESKIRLFWVNIEVIYFKDITLARKIWNDIIKQHKNDAMKWSKYIEFESRYGEISKAFNLFNKALSNTQLDYPQVLLQLWEDFIQLYGSQDTAKFKIATVKRHRIKLNEQYTSALQEQAIQQQNENDKKERLRIKDRANKAKVRERKKKERVGAAPNAERDGVNNEAVNSENHTTHDNTNGEDVDHNNNENIGNLNNMEISNDFKFKGRDPEATVFVCNFKDLSIESVRELFSEFGEIVEIRKPSSTARAHKNFYYVQFSNKDEANNSLNLDGKILSSGLALSVKLSNPKSIKQKRSFNDSEINPANLYVTNLPLAYTQENIVEHFKQFGTIHSIHMIKNQYGQFKGSCHINFNEKEAGIAALALNSTQIDSNIIAVVIADPKLKHFKKSFIENKEESPYVKTTRSKGKRLGLGYKQNKKEDKEENMKGDNLPKDKKDMSNNDFRNLLLGKK